MLPGFDIVNGVAYPAGALAGSGQLGKTYTFKSPIGSYDFDVPVEEITNDATDLAIKRLKESDAADVLLEKAKDSAVNDMWPALEPQVEKAVSAGVMPWIVGGGLLIVAAVAGAVWWIQRPG